MATDKTLDLALRIKTDLDEARKDLDQFTGSLTRAGEAADRSSKELVGTGSSANAAVASHKAVASAAASTAGVMQRGAISAGQYQQAMRQLPAQITDITTSLVSGMPIWMVAVQQGGQIKDSFGGIGPAARAVTGAINPMTLAIGAAVATVGALIIAHEQGASEARKYREALILTGNAAGTSTDQLASMAERIDGIAGTQRQAAAALAAAARTGKIAGADLEQVAQTAVQMQIAMGQAVEETIAEYVELAKDPVTALSKLDDKYHFLTASVLEQVYALQDQGKEAEAARLAMDTYSDTMQERTKQIAGDLGLIESAWQGIKNVASETWDAMLDVGREETIEDKLADVERRRMEARYGARGDRAGYTIDPGIQLKLDAERDLLLADQRRRDLAAETAREEEQTRQRGVKSLKSLAEAQEQALTREEQKAKAIAEYWRDIENARAVKPDSKFISEESIARGLADIETKFAPPKTRTATDTEAAASERWVAQLEREAATYGKDRSALKDYELGLMKLSDAQRARAETANAALATAEAQAAADKQATQDTKLLAQLQLDYLKATGQAVESAEAEIEKKYGELRDRLLSSGNEDGANLVSKLIGLETAQAQLTQVEQQVSEMFSATARQVQAVQAQLETGLITEGEARRRIVDLHQEQAAEVEKLLPLMQELAATTGDPLALENVERIKAELESMQVISNELAISFRDGLQSGLEEAIVGLADGTMTLRDALDSLLLGVADSMAQMASQGLAELATQGVMDLFAKGAQAAVAAASKKASAEVMAINTVTTAQTVADSTRATSSVVAANTQAAGQAGAAATTATAWTPAAIVASIGSFGGAAAIGLAAVVAAMATQAFADGGRVRGPGTHTSDSIPARLSNDEFVVRAAVVTQPGMAQVLEDVNTRGMAALDDWSGMARHATGGLAGVPAPAGLSPVLNNGRIVERAPSPSQVANNFRFNTVFDIDDVARRLGSSPAFQDVLITATASNSSAMKSALES